MSQIKRRKSLGVRLVLIPSIFLLFAMAGGITATAILHTILGDENAESRISLAVNEYARDFDDSLLLSEQTIQSAKLLIENEFYDVSLLSDGTYFADATKVVSDVFADTTDNNEFGCCYWFMVNPAYVDQTPDEPAGRGFFYYKDKISGNYVLTPPVNVLKGEGKDATIDWWTKAVNSPKPIWLTPYYYSPINYNLITYACACHDSNGNLIGVVGLDFDFDAIEKNLADIREFVDPRHFLIDSETTLLYSSPLVQTHDEQGHYIGTTITLYDYMGSDLKHYGDMRAYFFVKGDQNRVIGFHEIRNGMSYGISVDAVALYSSINRATMICIWAFVGASLVLAGVMVFLVHRLLKPLRRLNKEVQETGENGGQGKITVTGNDEISALASSVSEMLESIRAQQSALTALAQKDGLTGVKNTNARNEKVYRINASIANKEPIAFAIVMADVNDLKTINDTLGHPEGDEAIRELCYHVCHIFSHSPVFRIGGDEFVVIVEGEDYENRQRLFDTLKRAAIDPEKVKHTFSVGLATFHSDVDKDYESVYKRADEEMYAMKTEYKKKRGKGE